MTVAEEHPRVAVALCDRLGPAAGSVDLEAVCRSLERSLPGVHAEVVRGLSQRPEATRELVARTSAERLVLGVVAQRASEHEFQAWARKAGLDPFAVELVRLPAAAGTSRGATEATFLLAAAVARARAFTGSEPEQLRPRLLARDATLSRQSLLAFSPFTYEAVPSVDHLGCVGARLCDLCARVCPAEAIRAQGDRLVVDRDRCEACGLCVGACPVDAIRLPGSSLCQYAAEIGTLLAAERPAILLSCREVTITLAGEPDGDSPGWLPVVVPCLGMVTPGWALQALAGGAQAVGLLSCGQGCRFSTGSVLEERVAYVQALLSLLGDESASERVRIVRARREGRSRAAASVQGLRGPGRTARAREVTLTEPRATAEAALELSELHGGAGNLVLAHDASPLGLVRLREETCTTCGTCAGVCPTGALALEEEGEEVALTYDPTRCVACRRCALACPEAADDTLHVESVTDIASLAGGRATLKRETLALCRSCGRPIAPRRMLGRLRELLGGELDSGPLLSLLSEFCADCRSLRPAATPGSGGAQRVAAAAEELDGRSASPGLGSSRRPHRGIPRCSCVEQKR